MYDLGRLEFADDDVEVARDVALRQLYATREADLMRQAARVELRSLLQTPFHAPERQIEVLESLKPADLQNF